jgi:lipoprotein-anchoring transpeptidase ErfK/SrfK
MSDIRMSVAAKGSAMKIPLSATAFSMFVITASLAGGAPASAQSFWGSSWGANSVSDRQIVSFPRRHAPGQIILSFGDRRLYYIFRRGRAMSYPIAVPRARDRWQGVERVSMKRVNPPWTPTPSMRRENPRLPRFVPGGHPRNPLGVRAIYLGNTLYRIHGTDAPWTIGSNVSKGCIRMHNEHVIELYKRARVGMKVTATWRRFRTAAAGSKFATFNPFESSN